jgi:hypothetical protein
MFGHPRGEGALDALLACRELVKTKRGADEIVERAGGLPGIVKGMMARATLGVGDCEEKSGSRSARPSLPLRQRR